MIFLYSDILIQAGGVETYLHALALHLHRLSISFRVVVAELESCPLIDELISKGIQVYRQRRLLGDRWRFRQHVMLTWLGTQLQPNDWVFCVRQPMPQLYLRMVRVVHRCRAKLAVSWMLAPEFLPAEPPHQKQFCQAVAQTDAVISVSHCTKHQFKEVYGYTGLVQVVPLHNLLFFPEFVPLPSGPPWKIGFIGRLDIEQKNLDTLLRSLVPIVKNRQDVELHIYGRGADQPKLEDMAKHLGIQQQVIFHGGYDHRQDLPRIMENCHFFVYPSRFEGGPCFTLLEMVQAGRFCVAARVGGIPDLYEGLPDIGLLFNADDPRALTAALNNTLERVAKGEIDSQKIRDRYFDGFDMDSVHQVWSSILTVNS